MHFVVGDLSPTSQSKSKYYGFPLLFGMTGVFEEVHGTLLLGICCRRNHTNGYDLRFCPRNETVENWMSVYSRYAVSVFARLHPKTLVLEVCLVRIFYVSLSYVFYDELVFRRFQKVNCGDTVVFE